MKKLCKIHVLSKIKVQRDKIRLQPKEDNVSNKILGYYLRMRKGEKIEKYDESVLEFLGHDDIDNKIKIYVFVFIDNLLLLYDRSF